MEQATLSGSTVDGEKQAKALFGLLAKVLTTPSVTRLTGDDGSASADLRFSSDIERMVRIMKIAKTDERITKETEKSVFKLTDAEKLALLSNQSLKGPLNRDYYEEMQRLFYKVKGEEAYKAIFGDESPPERPLHVTVYDLWHGK